MTINANSVSRALSKRGFNLLGSERRYVREGISSSNGPKINGKFVSVTVHVNFDRPGLRERRIAEVREALNEAGYTFDQHGDHKQFFRVTGRQAAPVSQK